MAYPFINYAGLPLRQNTLDPMEIFSSYLKGKQFKEAPHAMERQRLSEELKNRRLAAEVQHAPEYYKNRAESGGYANLLNAMKANLLNQYGGREYEANIADTEASTALKKAQSQQGAFGRGTISPGQRTINSLPANVRNDMAAQMQAWGIDPQDGFNLLASGATMKDLKEEARREGVDVDNAPKIFSPTTANITQQKNAEGASAELDVLENETASGIAPYSRTFNGYSPKQIVHALTGTHKEERINYLASRALQPEIAGARARIAGGSNAQEALKEMQDKALGNSKVFQGLVAPEEYEEVQKRINEILKKGFKARKGAIYNMEKGVSSERAKVGMLLDKDLLDMYTR